MRKKQISRELFFISFSDIQRKYLSFVKIFSAGLSKLHSTCPAEHFEEKLVRKKIKLLFSNIEPKNFRPSGQSFSTGWWKLKVYGNIQTFFEKSNFFIILGHWAKKIFGRVVNTAFYASVTFGEKFFVEESYFFILFRRLSEKI